MEADPYSTAFAKVVKACDFTWWSQDRLTPENFPGESFDGGNYDLEWRKLSSRSDGYNADEIDAVVHEWQSEDASILGSATAGDGLFLAKEFEAGRRDQPIGWIVCPGSTSVDGGLLFLYRDGAYRGACVDSRAYRWYGGGLVLLRKVRKP